jgi:hypothetical protein
MALYGQCPEQVDGVQCQRAVNHRGKHKPITAQQRRAREAAKPLRDR